MGADKINPEEGMEGLQFYNNIMVIGSGLLFWIAFVIFGLISRRYSVVFNKTPFHLAIMLAPSGIFLYSLILLIKPIFKVRDAAVGDFLQLSAYVLFALSAVITLLAIMKFNKLIDELKKYKGSE